MKSGIWQIQIHEKDKYKTAFGQSEWNVMPFELINTLNKLQNNILSFVYWICLSLLFDPLNNISKYFQKMLFKHNVISESWLVSNIFIFQDKMTPPKSLSSSKERNAKIIKSWNFPPEIQNPEHLTPKGKGIAKVNKYADGPAESLQKVSQQIESFNLVNPKHLTPAEKGTAKVVEYAERPAERLQKKPQQIDSFNLVNPKCLIPAEKGKAKVNEYEESPVEIQQKVPQQIEFFNLDKTNSIILEEVLQTSNKYSKGDLNNYPLHIQILLDNLTQAFLKSHKSPHD